MVSLILYAALALIVAVVVVSVLVVVLPDDTVSVAPRDRVPTGLPRRGELASRDVNALRLPVGLRGYRMADTDAVLDRLSAELERRDEQIAHRDGEIARLRSGVADVTAGQQAHEIALGETPEEAGGLPAAPDAALPLGAPASSAPSSTTEAGQSWAPPSPLA